MDFDKVEILNIERNYHRRIFMEMLNINKFQNIINNNNNKKETDTQILNIIYMYLL